MKPLHPNKCLYCHLKSRNDNFELITADDLKSYYGNESEK